jgi:hypothetical protein
MTKWLRESHWGLGQWMPKIANAGDLPFEER